MEKTPNPLIGWNLQGIKLEIPKTIKEKTIKHKKHRNSTSSSSSSSSSSDSDQKLKHTNDKDAKRKEKEERRRLKREKKKLKKKLKMEHKLAKKELKKDKKYKKLGRSKSSDSDDLSVPVDLMNTSARAPETREQYEARQSEIRRLVDPDTGRTRLIKGDGEILEEIVTRDRHKEINKRSTESDGDYFQSKSIGWAMNKNK